LAVPCANAAAPANVVQASAAVRGLEPARGQRYVRLAPLADGRVVALYTLDYPLNCGLLKPCKRQAEVWHLVLDRRGIVAAPSRSSAELDAKPGLNSGTILSGPGTPYGDGLSAVFALGHSSHNAGGAHFIRIDGAGRVVGRGGGEGAYFNSACALGKDVIVATAWVDPITNGYVWYENGSTAAATTVNLGGYGYNYDGHQAFTCGASAALGGNFALLLRKQSGSHVGFSLYRAPYKHWAMVGEEVRLPVSHLPIARTLFGGGVSVGDDRGVVMFRDASVEGRRNMFYARFRITPKGIVLRDATPRPMPVSPHYEGIDGNLTYGGNGHFYVALYQAGESMAGQPPNHRQAVRFYALDFETGELKEFAEPYEDGNWSGSPPLSYYAESLNLEAFSLAKSCDGNLYVGGAVDGGKGPSVMKVFSLPLREPATTACVPVRPHSP
jgi:hypothetical protein